MSLVALTLAVTACGGGGSSTDTTPPPPPPPPPPPSSAVAAATATSKNNADCQAIGDFYWEIGDVNGILASGQVGTTYNATSVMNIASASKWLFGAYAVEKRNGVLDINNDVPFLNFTSGYVGFGSQPGCGVTGNNVTVDDCLSGTRGDQTVAEIGHFDYDSGHLQKYASILGLGSYTADQLGVEIGNTLVGSTTDLTYFNPQLAGDGTTSPQVYARYLRRLLVGSTSPLKIAALLGTNAVCTKASSTCNAVPGGSPTLNDWHYSMGHWVEDDADSVQNNNVAYSSAGAFGFYPWVDTTRTHYGIVARMVAGATTGSNQPEGFNSWKCGKQIRLAYQTGVEQTGTTAPE
jgi:hypothetical protein